MKRNVHPYQKLWAMNIIILDIWERSIYLICKIWGTKLTCESTVFIRLGVTGWKCFSISPKKLYFHDNEKTQMRGFHPKVWRVYKEWLSVLTPIYFSRLFPFFKLLLQPKERYRKSPENSWFFQEKKFVMESYFMCSFCLTFIQGI